MTRNNGPIGEDDLTAYVDGELSAERRALVEDWLEGHPEDRKRIEADIRIRDRLQGGLGILVDETLPDRFRVEEIATGLRARRFTQFSRLAAVFALVSVGVASGWIARGRVPVPMAVASNSDLALAAYQVYVPDKVRPVEITADASESLGVWLGNRIGLSVSVPDLSDSGLKLIGGRLLPGDDGIPAGQLMYEKADGSRVTLYFRAAKSENGSILFQETSGANTLAWQFGEMAYVLTGESDKDGMVELAMKVNASAS
jgi:anti-sigma factor RsiW